MGEVAQGRERTFPSETEMTKQFLVHKPISKGKSSSLQVQEKGHHESGRKLLNYQHCSNRINSHQGIDWDSGMLPPATGSGPSSLPSLRWSSPSQTSAHFSQ